MDLKEDFESEYAATEGLTSDEIEMDEIDFGFIRWYRTTYQGAFPYPFQYSVH